MGNFKKERKMKVYAQSGYKYKDTATIILKGDWLEDCGLTRQYGLWERPWYGTAH